MKKLALKTVRDIKLEAIKLKCFWVVLLKQEKLGKRKIQLIALVAPKTIHASAL